MVIGGGGGVSGSRSTITGKSIIILRSILISLAQSKFGSKFDKLNSPFNCNCKFRNTTKNNLCSIYINMWERYSHRIHSELLTDADTSVCQIHINTPFAETMHLSSFTINRIDVRISKSTRHSFHFSK